MQRTVIMGAGPAGLAAGYRLAQEGSCPLLLDKDLQPGGISKTIKHKGFLFDLGGHRFFTKISKVQKLWHEILGDSFIKTPRLSRIYYRNRFFDYPINISNALKGLGVYESLMIMLSYANTKIRPYSEENTFEQWVSNRFGRRLFSIFFKTYTEKVWGMPCSGIQAEWAAQRIKGLSLRKAIANSLFKPKKTRIKTLINEFYYPVYGPGMMYETMGNMIAQKGGQLQMGQEIKRVFHNNCRITGVETVCKHGETSCIGGAGFVSTIPITQLIEILDPAAPQAIRRAASKLRYRSLVTVDVITDIRNIFPDNWIYVHSPEVKLGRIQNFKNWSEKMVPDDSFTSLGLEYFCNEEDDFWNMQDEDLFKLACSELTDTGICKHTHIKDYKVVRVPKAYPVYDRDYRNHLNTVREYLHSFENLQLAGRYGMFRYNNMDHSILTGLNAAENILAGEILKDNWSVNTEDEYLEEKNNQKGDEKP